MRRHGHALLLRGGRPPAALGVVVAVLAIAAVTGLLYPLKTVAPDVSLGVVYLLGVLLVATWFGLWLGLATSVASAAAYNFFHLPPTGRFEIAASQNWVALVVFLAVAVAACSVAELARRRAAEAEERRLEADAAAEELRAAAIAREALQRELVETAALRRSDELKTTILRSVSHDLRTPLTGILAAGEALSSPTLTDEERTELADVIAQDGRRMARLVDDLLDLSRLQTGAVEPHDDWVSIDELLRTAVEDHPAGPSAFTLAVDRDLPLVWADAVQLERAFANLVDNAVRHSGGHPVSIRAPRGRQPSRRPRRRPRPGHPGRRARARVPALPPRRRRSRRRRPRPGHRARLRRAQRRHRPRRVAAGPGDLDGRRAAAGR